MVGVGWGLVDAGVVRVEVIVHHGMESGVKGRPDAGNVVDGSFESA